MFEAPLDEIDRICQRWATAVNGGTNEPWADTVQSKAPPLPDDLATEVDQAIRRAPAVIPHLLDCWYRKPLPAEAIAQRVGLARREYVYDHLRFALWYLLGLFAANGVLNRYRARCR